MQLAVTRSLRLSLALIALFVAADVIWLPLSRLDFDWASARGLLKAGIAIVVAVVVLSAIEWRLEGDDSRIAEVLRWAARTVGRLAPVLGVMALLTSSVALLSYLAAATAWPLQDARFAAWDRALGFDWVAWFAWLNANPPVAKALSAAYHTSFGQVIGLLVLLTILGRERDLWDFVALFALTSVAVILISIAVPAVGAAAYHAPGPAMRASFHPLSGVWHLDEFLGVRDGRIRAISLDRLEGIVQFPSFHTVLAIVTPYALRHVRLVFWPLVALNAVVIVSTLSEGGHYLVDVLAGAVLAAVAIAIVRRLGRGEVVAQPMAVPAVEPRFVWRPASRWA